MLGYHLVHVFPTFNMGGQQVRFADVVNRLEGRFRHTVIALDGMTTAKCLIEENDVLSIESWRSDSKTFRGIREYASLRRLKPTLLLTYSWGAIEWAMINRVLLRLPHLHFEDGFGVEESATRQLRRRILFRRIALGGPMTQIVVPSHQLHQLATRTWRFNPKQVSHVPNGIDCDRFLEPPDPRLAQQVNRQPDEVIIGTVSALRPEKNLSRLIRAFAALSVFPPSRLVIAGDGPARSGLEALVCRLGLHDRVLFLGAILGAQKVLSLFDLFVLSSDTEQMPYSVLEAMATGLPLVCTDVGDIRDMVSERNRQFIVPSTAEIQFVQALGMLLRDGVLRRELGQLNRERVKRHYSVAAMFATYDTLIRQFSNR